MYLHASLRVTLGLGLMALSLPQAARASISDAAIVSAVAKSASPGVSVMWTNPTYLYQDFSLTPVVEAGMALFQTSTGTDVAAVLVLLTEVSSQNPSGLYPHDYRVCESIHAATLLGITPFRAAGGSLLMMEMSQSSVHEFAATLQIREDGGNYVVDSQLLSVLYASGQPGKHYTFQVWSKDSATTIAMVRRLLSGLASSRPLVVLNTLPRTVPAAWVRSIQVIGDGVLLDLESPHGVSGLNIALVSWKYPNPVPTVQQSTINLAGGEFMTLLPVTAATTDVQVYLTYQGILQDEVLSSFNAWGPLTSGWYAFSDQSGSTASLLRSPLSGLPPELGEVVMNGSSVALSGTLVAGGFVGMYVDVLPALHDPGDLRAYDRFILRARQTSSLASAAVQIKLELDDGTTRSTMITIGGSWAAQEIPVSRFGNWESIGRHIRRLVVAVSNSTGPISLDIDRLSLRSKALSCSACRFHD
jgi:hypothetical protein